MPKPSGGPSSRLRWTSRAGIAGPETGEREAPDSRPEHTTQWRWVHRAARLTAVARELGEGLRRRVALRLGISVLFVADQVATSIPGLTHLAQAVVAVLGEAVEHDVGVEAVLESGFLVGLWGPAFTWDAEAGVLRCGPGSAGAARAPP